jgi:hypothetical protein
MTDKEFCKLVDVYYQQYVDRGYDLFTINVEESMLEATPNDYFEGGEREKDARETALWGLYCKLMNDRMAV